MTTQTTETTPETTISAAISDIVSNHLGATPEIEVDDAAEITRTYDLDEQTHVYSDEDFASAELEEVLRLTRAALSASDANESEWFTREAFDILSRIDP